MQELFTTLTRAVEGGTTIAILASFIWGILSILLSPCHLASIPLIVGFISGQEVMSTKRAFGLSALFSLGILITIATIGIITGLMGRMLGDIGSYGNYIVAVIFFITIPFLGNLGQPTAKKKGAIAAFMLGLAFGLALGPCTFAYMAPILGIVFTVAATQFIYAVILLLMYGIGHCSVIVVAGTFTEVVQNYLNWNVKSKGISIVKKICGVLVILGGIYLIWSA